MQTFQEKKKIIAKFLNDNISMGMILSNLRIKISTAFQKSIHKSNIQIQIFESMSIYKQGGGPRNMN